MIRLKSIALSLSLFFAADALAQRRPDVEADWKDTVRLATTAALASNTASGNGQILTITANGACASMDSVALALNDPVLIKDEVTAAKNGIYTVSSLGGASAQCKFTRRADANTGKRLKSGSTVRVQRGTVNTGLAFYLAVANPITVGTTSQTWTQTAGSGSGSGDVVGPASATDNAIARFDTTTGKLIQNSAVTIADTTGNITLPALSTIDGRDPSVDGTKLDGIEAGADDVSSAHVVSALASQSLTSLVDITNTGATSHGGIFSLTNDITPTILSANQDNYAPTGGTTAAVWRISGDALNRSLTGITGGADGRILKLENIGTQPILLLHDQTSTAANRFSLPSSTTFTLLPGATITLIYDATLARWTTDSASSGLWLDTAMVIGGGSHGALSTGSTGVGYGLGVGGFLATGMGNGSDASGSSATGIGAGFSCTHSGSGCFGRAATSNAANQMTFGSTTINYSDFRVAQGANGQELHDKILTESLTLAAAATSDTVIQIPAFSLVHWVTMRVTTAVTGCTTIDYGISGATTRYGTGILLTANTTNTGPDSGGTPRFYTSATAIRFTCIGSGGSFTGGVVRVTIHYETVTIPSN